MAFVSALCALWTPDAPALAQPLSPAVVSAQTIGAGAGEEGSRPAYALLRDEEDWSFLRDPDQRRDPWDRIKFIPLSKDGDLFLTLGGEIRQQFERFSHEEWGEAPEDPSGYLLQRYMFHADLRVRRRLRAFVQVKSALETGRRDGPGPADEDTLDLHQGYVELALGTGTAARDVAVRVGRQEFSFGSSRLVSVREAPNVRQSFDAVRAIVRVARWRVDAFLSRPVTTETGVFDDESDRGRAFWGVYGVRPLDAARAMNLDVYYFGLARSEARFDQGRGRERRHSLGSRYWGHRGRLDYNVEGVWQWGTFADRSDAGLTRAIRAWTIASDAGWRLNLPGRPRLGLRADVSSGDRDREDHRLGTFNPLFPKGAYFGLIAPTGPLNHMDLHPQVDLELPHDWSLGVNALWFWRTRIDDGVYGVATQLVRSGLDTRARFVGFSPGIEVEKQLTPHLTLNGQVSLFTAGAFIQAREPARDIGFVAAIATYKF